MPAPVLPAAVPAVRPAGGAPPCAVAATTSPAAGATAPAGAPPGGRFGALLEARLSPGLRPVPGRPATGAGTAEGPQPLGGPLPPVPAPDAASARAAGHARPAPHPVAAALRGVEAAQARLDAVLAAARGGRSFTAGELLALQAEAHRFSQALDVAGKLVEHGVQGVKQALQAQV